MNCAICGKPADPVTIAGTYYVRCAKHRAALYAEAMCQLLRKILAEDIEALENGVNFLTIVAKDAPVAWEPLAECNAAIFEQGALIQRTESLLQDLDSGGTLACKAVVELCAARVSAAEARQHAVEMMLLTYPDHFGDKNTAAELLDAALAKKGQPLG